MATNPPISRALAAQLTDSRIRTDRPSGLSANAAHPPAPPDCATALRASTTRLPFVAFFLAVLFAAGIITAVPTPASAQSAPRITDNGVTNTFPDGMVFAVSAESDSPIEEIKLRYEILPDGTAAIGRPEFDPATSVAATFELRGGDPYLPPGTLIEYHWEGTDADGDESRTETQSFFYDDVRFQWQPIEAGGVTVFFYSGSEDDAQTMLQAGSETMASMSELLDANVDFPVKVWIYEDREDMQPALMRRSEMYEERITTLGVRVASDTVLVLGNTDVDTLQHELTHVVTKVAGESPFGTLPFWLDEGTAVYGQNDPGSYREAVEQAIERGNVFSLRQITSDQGDPTKVVPAYGQSWSVVNYLIETHGPEKFAQLFAEVKGGKRVDDALEAVYGFDQDGLDNEWRAANGLPPRDTPEPTQDASEATPAPSDSQAEPQAEDGGGGTSPVVIIALALGLVVLAGAVGLTGWAVSRRL